MKKLLCLILAALMLLTVVGCGGTTSSGSGSSQPDTPVNDPNAYLTDLFHGIYELEERDGTYGNPKLGGGSFVPKRFSTERLKAYEDYNKSAKIAAPYFGCTVGVRLDFYTDAKEISFHYAILDAFYDGDGNFKADTFDIYEDGVYQLSIDVIKGLNGDVKYTRTSTAAESRITVVFPLRHGIACSEFNLGNTRPLEEAENRVLFLGDSITQGLFCDKASDNYPHLLSQELGFDYMNLSVGGEIYRAESLDEDIHYDPTHIIIALGTNDYYGGVRAASLRANANAYLTKLKEIYPNADITVISPFSDFDEKYNATIEEVAKSLNLDYINGITLISRLQTSWNTDAVHPNTKGFAELCESLKPILQEKLN